MINSVLLDVNKQNAVSPFSNEVFNGRVALSLSYDGSAYSGWQSQASAAVTTVQTTLEQALSYIANQPIVVQCAGRTDAGVHASHQVVHFDCLTLRSEKAWVSGANTVLPSDIAVHWAKPVTEEFNARHSARARRYRYIILNTASRPALMPKGVTWEKRHLDENLMHQAAQALLGELDFTSFRAAGCQSNTSMRHVDFVTVYRQRDLVIIDIQANAFLYHMVRNIAGTLMMIGAGKQAVTWVGELLLARDRRLAAPTAKANGLYLVDVSYPECFELSLATLGPYFLNSPLT